MFRIPLTTIINTLHVFITLFSYVLEVFHMMLYYFSINGDGIQALYIVLLSLHHVAKSWSQQCEEQGADGNKH